MHLNSNYLAVILKTNLIDNLSVESYYTEPLQN